VAGAEAGGGVGETLPADREGVVFVVEVTDTTGKAAAVTVRGGAASDGAKAWLEVE
jgi:hypothetical protein